jgi:hypothetical protein
MCEIYEGEQAFRGHGSRAPVYGLLHRLGFWADGTHLAAFAYGMGMLVYEAMQ